MAIESNIESTGYYINTLNDANPDGSNSEVNELDNHIRGIKNLILNTFANITGAVTVTHTQINNAASLLTNVTALASTDDVVDNFPAGTVMLFYQAAAPTGWTGSDSLASHALQVVTELSATGGGTGGSSPFSTVFALTATDGHQLTVAEMPSHTHSGTIIGSYSSTNISLDNVSIIRVQSVTTSGNTGGDGSHSHAIDLQVQYANIIMASKD